MPRNARKNMETSYAHLIVQGINGEYIFQQEEWKKEYKKTLKNKIESTDIEILGYCIMDNHAHFLIYYSEVEKLSDLMRKVNTTYAMRYNKINKRKGYVFRDRFFTQPIMDEIQLYNCLVYIHRNPVSSGMCFKMKDYAYSSYNEYIQGKGLITSNSIEMMFGSKYKYIEQFNTIHNKLIEIEDIKDVTDYKCNVEEIIKKYEDKFNGDLNNNEIDFGKMLLEIRQKCGISLREMSKILNINKDKLNKYIHKIIDND